MAPVHAIPSLPFETDLELLAAQRAAAVFVRFVRLDWRLAMRQCWAPSVAGSGLDALAAYYTCRAGLLAAGTAKMVHELLGSEQAYSAPAAAYRGVRDHAIRVGAVAAPVRLTAGERAEAEAARTRALWSAPLAIRGAA